MAIAAHWIGPIAWRSSVAIAAHCAVVSACNPVIQLLESAHCALVKPRRSSLAKACHCPALILPISDPLSAAHCSVDRACKSSVAIVSQNRGERLGSTFRLAVETADHCPVVSHPSTSALNTPDHCAVLSAPISSRSAACHCDCVKPFRSSLAIAAHCAEFRARSPLVATEAHWNLSSAFRSAVSTACHCTLLRPLSGPTCNAAHCAVLNATKPSVLTAAH